MPYDFETRLEVVLYAKKNGIASAAREYGTSKSSIRKWLDDYRAQGEEGLKQYAAPSLEKVKSRISALEKRLNVIEQALKKLMKEIARKNKDDHAERKG